MSESQQLELVTLFFNVVLLAFGYRVLYQGTRRDQFRENLFSIRDELFDYMWKNHISYDLLAYGRLRYTLNGMIRSIDDIHLSALISSSFAYRNAPKTDLIAEAIESIENLQVKQHFGEVYDEVRTRTVHYFYLEGWQWFIFRPLQMFVKFAVPRRLAGVDSLIGRCYRWIYTKMDQWANQCLVLGKAHSPEAQLLREPSTFSLT